MLSRKIYIRPWPSFRPASLSSRPRLLAAPAGPNASHRRWSDRATIISSPQNAQPSRAADATHQSSSSTLSSRPWGSSQGAVLARPAHSSSPSQPLSRPYETRQPSGNQGGAWAQLAPRPSPSSQSTSSQRGDWGQLAHRPPLRNQGSEQAPGTKTPNPYFRQEPPKRSGPDAGNTMPKAEQFWTQLESRVGKDAPAQDGWQSEGARDRMQWTPRPPPRRGAGTPLGRDGRRGHGDRNNSREQPSQNNEGHNLFVPEIDVAVPTISPFTKDEPERRGKQRKENPRAAKSKSKKTAQDRGFADEDDDFDVLDEDIIEQNRRKAEKKRQREEEAAAAAAAIPIMLPQFISVTDLASALRVKPHTFLQGLDELGFEDVSLESIMTGETAALVAQEYGFNPKLDTGDFVDLKRRPPPEDPSALPERPPIVTIMGHVDHGKTTMLDWLRKSSVAAHEHGGITQHIGAFSVRLSTGKQITFLDTPGHAAFLTMRQRGANVTDIVVLVVAADDSVKPQTLEALKHARSSKVPIIVAINKIDKEEARVEQVKADLSRHGIEIEDFGGDVQVACVSGKTGLGMDTLEENIVTLAEILDVRADPGGMAEGWVLESSVKSIGRSASILVKNGTLRVGDIITAGTTWAKIRIMRNEAGVEVGEAAPGMAVEILGWRDLPDAGDEVIQAPTEQQAKGAIFYRLDTKKYEKAAAEVEAQEQREKEKAALAEAEKAAQLAREAAAQTGEEAKGFDENAAEKSGIKMVGIVVKGDVMGSVEAVCASILEIGNNEVRPDVRRFSPGQVTESDVDYAATTNSIIVNFNVPLNGHIKRMAENAGVVILDHSVIYHVVDEVKGKLSEHLAPNISIRVLGEAEVRQVFPINIKGRIYKNVAGCHVTNGQVTRSGQYKLIRKDKVVFQGTLQSLKQGKRAASEIRKGTDCGMELKDWDDVQVGDKIQAYEEVSEKRYL